MKSLVYKPEMQSVCDFLGRDNIDADPAHQRPQIQDNNKRKGIIEAMISGIDIGEIKLNQTSEDPEELEVIDGSNRLRSIRQFADNEFSISEKTFSELSSEEQDIFLNYPLRYIIYDNLSPRDKAYQFQATNKTTHVNHQEKLNSYGVDLLASMIRECVRTIPGTDTVPEALFQSSINRKGDKLNFRFFQFDNNQLKIEDDVARIAYLCNSDEGLIGHEDKKMEKFYDTHGFNEKEIKSLQKKMKKVFTFVMKNANARMEGPWGLGLSRSEFKALYRLYFHLTEKYGSFHIDDYAEFFKAFKKGHDAFASGSASSRKKIVVDKNGVEKLEHQVYDKALGSHEKSCVIATTYLLEEFDVEQYLTNLDNKRVFTVAEKEIQLQKQDFKCWIDGLPLAMNEAEGGHIISHIEGGRSDVTTDNLRMMRRIYNRKMGKQNARKWKEKFLAEKNKEKFLAEA